MGLRSLYNWVVQQAKKPYAEIALFFVAVIEACLLPCPPDLLLIPMSIARHTRAFRFAAIATLGSVLGAIIGYEIGALAMRTIGHLIIDTYNWQNGFEHFHCAFNRYGMWIILMKGLTPIPFILVTITSGVAHLPMPIFIASCALTRGARFFLEAVLIYFYGASIERFIERYLPWVALAVLVAIIGGFWFVLRSSGHHVSC